MINYILVIFYTIGRNAPKNRLTGTSLLLTTPVALLLVAFFIVVRHFIFFEAIPLDAISFGILGIITAIIVNRLLDRIYKKQGKKIMYIAERLKKPIVALNIFITIIVYLGSIFLFFLSLRFLS